MQSSQSSPLTSTSSGPRELGFGEGDTGLVAGLVGFFPPPQILIDTLVLAISLLVVFGNTVSAGPASPSTETLTSVTCNFF